MWKCSHCESINKGGEVCRSCGYPKTLSGYGAMKANGSPISNVIKRCAGSNVSISAVIFFAAYILLQIISVLITVNSATNILQNKMTVNSFGISGLSASIVAEIINYSMSAVIVLSLPSIVICVFGMIFCFYARANDSELKITALKAIKIVEIINIVLSGIAILTVLISSVLIIPSVPDLVQGNMILACLLLIGAQVLNLIFKIFLIIALTSLINTIQNDELFGRIPVFVGVMLFIYGALAGLTSLISLAFAAELTLSMGCLCTANILFAVALFKLKNELEKVSYPTKPVLASYSYGGYGHNAEKPAAGFKIAEDLEPIDSAVPQSKLKGNMGPRYKSRR